MSSTKLQRPTQVGNSDRQILPGKNSRLLWCITWALGQWFFSQTPVKMSIFLQNLHTPKLGGPTLNNFSVTKEWRTFSINCTVTEKFDCCERVIKCSKVVLSQPSVFGCQVDCKFPSWATFASLCNGCTCIKVSPHTCCTHWGPFFSCDSSNYWT